MLQGHSVMFALTGQQPVNCVELSDAIIVGSGAYSVEHQQGFGMIIPYMPQDVVRAAKRVCKTVSLLK